MDAEPAEVAGQHPGGDRHGDGEDVVDQQGARDNKSGLFAEILVCYFEVAAAGWVGLDELTVRRNNGDEHDDDYRRDPWRKAEEAQSAEHEDEQQFLRRVGDGGERVAGKDGQREMLGEELPLELVGG